MARPRGADREDAIPADRADADPVATTGAPGSTDEHRDGRETAPIAALFDRDAGAEPPSPDGGAGSGREDGHLAPPVRLRDVWRASRGRRRALRAEVRRFTVRQRRRRMLWAGVLASLALLIASTVGAAYSPLFALRDIRVVGTERLPAEDVADALSGQLGTPLAAVDESQVKAALVRFPLVESYTLEARPPHDLVVRIVERTPVGVLPTAAGYTLVDAAGVVLATSAEPAEGYPILEVVGGAGSAAFAAAGEVMRALPAPLRAQVTAASASTPNDVTLTLGDTGTQVVWGSAEASAMKAFQLERIMAVSPPDAVSVYDVSSDQAIVVR